MKPKLRLPKHVPNVLIEATIFFLIYSLWLAWTIAGESPTKFIYYNF